MKRYNIDAESILYEIPTEAIIEFIIKYELVDDLLGKINAEDVFEEIIKYLDKDFILERIKD